MSDRELQMVKALSPHLPMVDQSFIGFLAKQGLEPTVRQQLDIFWQSRSTGRSVTGVLRLMYKAFKMRRKWGIFWFRDHEPQARRHWAKTVVVDHIQRFMPGYHACSVPVLAWRLGALVFIWRESSSPVQLSPAPVPEQTAIKPVQPVAEAVLHFAQRGYGCSPDR